MDFNEMDILRFIAQTGHAAQINLERHFPDHEKFQKYLKNLEDLGTIWIYHKEKNAESIDFSEDLYEITPDGKRALDDLAKE